MNSICHLSLQGHVIKAFYDFMVWSHQRTAPPIQSLVGIDTVVVEM